MYRIPAYLLCIVMMTVSSCERHKDATGPLDTRIVVISYGTSFGECLGYCHKELMIVKLEVTFTATSLYPQKDVKELNTAITHVEYDQIQSLVDFARIQAYKDVIGCPDCADGGAEWLEVIQEEQYKKITFECGDTLESIQPLITKLRQMHAAYNKQMFPGY